MGKIEEGGLWLQANTEYPERRTVLTVEGEGKPEVTAAPSDALMRNEWDESSGRLSLTLSHERGAVEVSIRFSDE